MKSRTHLALVALALGTVTAGGLGSRPASAATTCSATAFSGSPASSGGAVACTGSVYSITPTVRVQRLQNGTWSDVGTNSGTCYSTSQCSVVVPVDYSSGGWFRTIAAGTARATQGATAFSTAPNVNVYLMPATPTH
jgi:hypothetical protein